jgi:hypothetical protein
MNSEITSDIQGFASLLFPDGVYLIIQYQYNGGSRRLNFYYGRGGVGNFANFHLTTLGTSNWHHLVFTYNSSTGEIRGYLDDSNIIDFTNNSPITNPYGFVNLFSLGSGWDSGSVDHFASCKIDEVGIWSRALSAAEVSLLYGNGNGMPYSTSLLLPEPPATNRYLWRGQSLTSGFSRPGQTNGNSVFYVFGDDVNGDGQLDAGDDFVVAEYMLLNTNATLTTLSRQHIASLSVAQSYGLASVNLVNSSNKVFFTGEPDGQVFAWTATGPTNPLNRQLFSAQYVGKSWQALAGVKTLEPGEGLVGLSVDPTNQNTCGVIFWPSQPQLPQLASLPNTAPAALVLPSINTLGSLAVVTVRLWDAEGNASTPFLQYQFTAATNWLDATLTALDGAPYSTNSRVAALPSGTNHTLAWNAMADLGAGVVTNVLLRVRARDFMLVGDWSLPTPFQIDTTSSSTVSTNVVIGPCQVLPNGSFQFAAIGGVLGQSYVVLASTNLVNWIPISGYIFTNPPITIIDPDATQFPWRFYRIGPLSSASSALRLAPSSAQPLGTNCFNLTLFSLSGLNYQIEASTDLVNWVTITNFATTNSPFYFTDPSATNYSRRFYRSEMQ